MPQPSFPTPPKLKTVEAVLGENTGTDENSLRQLALALARDAVYGKDEFWKYTLSSRNDTHLFDKE